MTAPKALSFALFTGLIVSLMTTGPADAAVTDDHLVTITPGSGLLNISETRTTGHVDFTKYGLHVWTEANTSTDKAAGYIAVDYPLTEVGSPSLEWLYNEPLHLMKPGLQIVIDKNADGTPDGILVGEPWVYGDEWWSGSAGLADSGLICESGCGSTNSGTLDQWRSAFESAQVMAVGFSLGSGAHGNGTLTAMTYGDTRYEFSNVEPTVKPVVTLQATAVADTPRCRKIRVSMHVKRLPAGTVASPSKVIFTIKDRDRRVGHAALTPGARAVFRDVLRYDHRVHVYRVYAGSKLILKFKGRNTCR